MPKAYRLRFRFSTETIVVLCLLAAIFFARTWRLEADPPATVSGSTDIYTDPPQYTLNAKTFVEDGRFNPFDDTRFVFFLKSSVTALATIVFKLFGTGMTQGKLVGLLYSFGGLLFFFLFLKRRFGPTAGLIYLVLIGINYNQFFYGRYSFLENGMWFYAALSLWLVTCYRKHIGYAVAGMALAVAVFFGKIIGVVFLFPFACLLVHEALTSDDKRGFARFRLPLFYAGGFGLVLAFWVLFSYLPMQQEVAGYIGEKTFSLYGAPEGLQSFDDFVWKFVSFGVSSELFPRMTIVALFGAIFVGFVFFHVGRRERWRQNFSAVRSGQLFIAAMIVAFFGSLMIWNYQPLRYEMVLIYPFCGAAAILLSKLWQSSSVTPSDSKLPRLFPILIFPIALVVVSQTWSGLADHRGWEFAFDDIKYQAAGIAAVLTFLIVVALILVRKHGLKLPLMAGRVMVMIALGGAIGRSVELGAGWFNWPTYTIRDNSADLRMIVSPNAVLSGPYAAALTQDNELGCVIHMFGVVDIDSTLFTRFPITHLLLDESNEKRARNDYPSVMEGAVSICTYHVGVKKVRLYRIAGQTGNEIADRYQRSPFEMLVDHYRAGNTGLMQQYLLQFTENHPSNMSGYMLAGELARKADQFAQAEQLMKKAVEFSPTNYNLIGNLAMLYKNRFDATGDLVYKNLALERLERALKFAPTSNRMKELYAKLKGLNVDD